VGERRQHRQRRWRCAFGNGARLRAHRSGVASVARQAAGHSAPSPQGALRSLRRAGRRYHGDLRARVSATGRARRGRAGAAVSGRKRA